MIYGIYIDQETYRAYAEYCHQYGIISLPFGDVERHYMITDESQNPPRIHWLTPRVFHDHWKYEENPLPSKFQKVSPR